MNRNAVITIVVVVLLVLVGAYFMNQPDNRGAGERLDDAVERLSEGGSLGDAANEMEDKSAAERAGDAIDDAADNVREDIDNATH
ncbi:MAG: hypothetical protein GC136_10135 [Alphaproteobacteria bacterium]|nr:hypothetical protein [Alphaproteobacteria bacterium]